MKYEEMEFDWSVIERCKKDENEEDVLDEKELAKLQFFAEHPELDDPDFWHVPEKRKHRG